MKISKVWVVACPECGAPLPWTDRSTVRVCRNIDCRAKVRKAQVAGQLTPGDDV